MPRLQVLAFVAALLPGTAVAQETVTWADLQPFFQARCAGCHSGAGSPLGLQLDAYANAIRGSNNGPVLLPGDPGGSELIRRVRGASLPQMPLAGVPLTEDEIDRIVAWIDAGLPEGGTAGAAAAAAPAPPVAAPLPGDPVTFAHVERTFLQRCVVCHSVGGRLPNPPEGLRLDTYENVIAGGERIAVVPGRPQLSELIRRVVGLSQPRMPADGPPFLPDEDIDLLRRRIADGARDAAGAAAPIPVGGEVRFRGVFTGQWAIDDAPFTLGPARVEDQLRPGEAAEMRGIVQPDGSIIATRLRSR